MTDSETPFNYPNVEDPTPNNEVTPNPDLELAQTKNEDAPPQTTAAYEDGKNPPQFNQNYGIDINRANYPAYNYEPRVQPPTTVVIQPFSDVVMRPNPCRNFTRWKQKRKLLQVLLLYNNEHDSTCSIHIFHAL